MIWDMIFGPRPKPKPPVIRLRPVAVNTGVDGARVRLEAFQGHFVATADANGRAGFPSVPESMTTANLHIEAEGYQPYGEVVTILPGAVDLFPQLVSLRRFPAEQGLLTIEGVHFHTEDGALWQWRNVTSFLLFFRFLKGEDIQPVINEWVSLGANMVRVLGMVDWAHRPEVAGQFWPQKWPDYYTQLSAFVDLLAKNGLRVEFVVFADAQIIMFGESLQEQHLAGVVQALKDKWNVVMEISNEPFKNIPGKGKRAHAFGKRWQKQTPLLIASGAGGLDIDEGDFNALRAMTLDYGTTHTIRGSEWMRKQKDALEIQNKLGVPVVSDEPTGADEIAIGASRSNNPTEFGEAAAVLALQVAGGTFHSSDGNSATLLRPVTKQCAEAWFEAMQWVGPEAQAGEYTAGHLHHCPIEHSDALAMRTFGSIMGNTAKVVVVRPTAAWTPIVKHNWQIAERHGPRGARLLLKR